MIWTGPRKKTAPPSLGHPLPSYYDWWDSAIAYANFLADLTGLRHRVTSPDGGRTWSVVVSDRPQARHLQLVAEPCS